MSPGPAQRACVLAIVAATSCTGEVIEAALPGTGKSGVIVFADGAFALDRDHPTAPIPAIPIADATSGAVLALDYAVPLASLQVTPGALDDDPAGGPLPAPATVRRLGIADGAAIWETVDRAALDPTRAFRGVVRAPAPCLRPVLTAVPTSTEALAGEPRFIHNAGPRHLWVGLADQPVRAVDSERGVLSRVELDGEGSILSASTSVFGGDYVWTVRVRGGHPQLEEWQVDLTRPGQVMRAPRRSVTLPDGEYRWLDYSVVQGEVEIHALAREGLWVRYDGRTVDELARWDAPLEPRTLGGIARNQRGDVMVALSDSSTARWVRNGEAMIHELALGQDPLLAAGHVLADELAVSAASGVVFVLTADDRWLTIDNRTFAEPPRGFIGVLDTQFVSLGTLGSVVSWRADGGWCDPGVLTNRPEIYAWSPVSFSSRMLVARDTNDQVSLTRLELVVE